MKQTPTKQKLLTLIKKGHEVTITDMLPFFTISEIAVRKHIQSLVRDGFIKKNSIKQKLGRPYFTYELTEKGHGLFPNQNEKLPLELLQDLEYLQGKRAVDDLLWQRMLRERNQLEDFVGDSDFDGKVKEMAKFQDGNGYMVELKKVDVGHYEMKNYHCPISALSSKYTQVCQNEKAMYQDIFSTCEVISHTCITDGKPYCMWTIKQLEER
ncbi:MAG: helix-turn-helix transcriptional regulator [Bacillota bacterium]|uniref:Transcriptional regulator n=1 Tax=Virgibacillus salarius TaxID=447199 RepID=A0A941DPI1_9BACI|nr:MULTISPECIES: hypothetical protein [Bacillaceae]MBR7794529.1 hypothetical protein [Virgibacillus salarius]MCC2249482.1 hypothetical protein [Virgibacillus sp. AGTR]NAZ07251.1 hypothetical protein [Agaribacter marinus]QRZ17848.1 hypothetical protein JUJ52_19285 [Virgibacillus sp. AGTR]